MSRPWSDRSRAVRRLNWRLRAARGQLARSSATRLSKRRVFTGLDRKTKSGLVKEDLVKNKHGRIVSIKKSLLGRRSPWMAAVVAARYEVDIIGFAAIKKGSPLHKKAKEILRRHMLALLA